MAMMEDKGKNGIGKDELSVKIVAGGAFFAPQTGLMDQLNSTPEQRKNESETNR